MNKWMVGMLAIFLSMTLPAAWGQLSKSGRDAPVEEQLGSIPWPWQDARFSKDGCHVAIATKRGDKQIVVVDGQEGPEYDMIFQVGPIFSPDGKRLAYAAKKGQKWLVVMDGHEGPEYDGIDRLDFSPNGKRLIYGAKRPKVACGYRRPGRAGV